jgi:hypothetical protein
LITKKERKREQIELIWPWACESVTDRKNGHWQRLKLWIRFSKSNLVDQLLLYVLRL